MNEQTALHTATRRYCAERATHWRSRYAELAPHDYQHGYTDAEKNTFPRYNVLEAILVEIERLRPESFDSLKDAREMIILAAQVADSMFTKPAAGAIQALAMQEERDALCFWIDTLDAASLAGVSPMPYRHALTDQESEAIWERLNSRWSTGGSFWYPLSGEAPANTVAFDANAFHEHISSIEFQRILSNHEIQNIFELREYGPEYELEVSLACPF